MQTEEQIPGIDDDLPPLPVVDELTALKEKADLVGLRYHPNIGLDTLRERYEAHIAATSAPKGPAADEAPAPVVQAPVVEEQLVVPQTPAAPQPVAPVALKKKTMTPKEHADFVSVGPDDETAGARRMRLKRHALELIRIRVTCMNPAKKEWEGEIFAAGNSTVGTVTKYVPFNLDEGYHVTRIMYNVIRDRQAQIFVTVKNEKGAKVRTGKMIKEFAVEVMDPLTEEDLEVLKADQLARRAID